VLLAAVMAAEAAVVVAAAARYGSHWSLQVALAADCLLLGALGLWLLARAGGGMDRLSLTWRRVLKLGVGAAVLFVAASRVAGVSLDGPLVAVVVGLELTVLGGMAWALWKGRRVEELLGELLPPGVRAVALMELRLMRGAVVAVARRPVRRPEGTFTTLERSGSGFILPMFAMLTAAEMGAVHALIAGRWPGAWGVHAALAGLNAYGFLWLLGDRRAMRETGHRVEGRALVLELGLRFQARFPLGMVQKALRLRGPARHTRVTPFDPPNVHLCLTGPVEYRTYFGLRRRTQHLDLYVDEPERFLAAVAPAPAPG
jgi:hypothetical protein